jgi:hypothetical protein
MSMGMLIAGIATTMVLSTSVATPAWAAEPAGSPAASSVSDPTNLASPEEKVKAAAAIGINPGVDMLVLDDQAFVLALWRAAKPGSYVKAEALRAWDSTDQNAAYQFIVSGIFVAANDDARAEIVAEQGKALRRSVLVTVGLDPSDTVLIEQSGDKNFIFEVFLRLADGTRVKAAAAAAIAVGSTQEDWTEFLTTGAAAARQQDIEDELRDKSEEEAARIKAEQLVAAKRSLLQLLLLPVSTELVNAPNRQYVLHVLANAKGIEVKLAAQAAINAVDAELEQALSDFIFTGGAAANRKDEDAAAAKELAGYRDRVTAIRDAARAHGLQPNLLAAADSALANGTVLTLQTFLLKGQDEARAIDVEWQATFLHDFNSDGKADVAAINSVGNMVFYAGNGAGKLTTSAAMWATDGTWGNFIDIVAGDFNGDRKTDIAGINSVGNLKLYLGNGAGKLTAGGYMWATDGSWKNFTGITAGDFNGGGKIDIAGINSAGNLLLYAGNGAGTLTAGVPMWTTDGTWKNIKVIA